MNNIRYAKFIIVFVFLLILPKESKCTAVELESLPTLYQKYIDNTVTPEKKYTKDCWAACIKMIFQFYKITTTYIEILNECTAKEDEGVCICGGDGKCGEQVEKDVYNMFTDHGLDCSCVGGKLTFTEIKGQIDLLRPIYCSWVESGTTNGHAVVISGYDADNTWVLYHNPSPDGGDVFATYESFCYDGVKWEWSRSITFDAQGCPLGKRVANPLGLTRE